MAVKTREKLIEVARQLFVHKGVAKTTMNDIANASAKGRRTVYTYFKNKKDIYNAVLEAESDRLVTSLREIVESHRPVVERLYDFLRFRIEHNNLQSSTSLKALLKFDMRRTERINRKVQEKENLLLTKLLDEGCELGAFKRDRCDLLMDFINRCISLMDIPEPDNEKSERRERTITAFIEFIVSDISI